MRSFLWCIILFYIPLTFAQRFPIYSYANDRGLNTQIAYDVAQDSSGRIWVATDRGVSVYDGYSWKNFESNSLKGFESFRRVCCAKGNIVYAIPFLDSLPVLMYNGIDWISIGSPAAGKRSGRIQDACSFSIGNENILLITVPGYGIRVYKNDSWFTLGEKDGLPSSILYTSKTLGNKCYLATAAGLTVYDGTKFVPFAAKMPNLPAGPILAIDCIEEHGSTIYYFLFRNLIGKFSNSSFSVITRFPDLFTQSIMDYNGIKCSPNGFFFGNDRQKWYYESCSGRRMSLTPDHGFGALGMTNLLRDREGNFWFSSARGLDKLSNPHIQFMDKLDGMLDNEATSVTELPDGRLLIGHNLGFSIWDGEKMSAFDQKKYYPISSIIGRILHVIKTRSGNYIAAGGNLGIMRIDKSGKQSTVFQNDSIYFTTVAELSDGNLLVSSNRGTYVLIHDQFHFRELKKFAPRAGRRIFPLHKNKFFCCSQGGLFIIDVSAKTSVTLLTGRGPEFNIYAVFALSDTNLLVGSLAGLYQYKGGRYSKMYSAGSSLNNPVYFIEKSKDGVFWIGTNDGIVAWDGKGQFKRFTQCDGLMGKETNRGAICFDKYERIWVGTEKAVNCLSNKSLQLEVPVPERLEIRVISSSGQLSDSENGLSFSPNDNTLRFYVRAYSFYDEAGLQYEYKLSGNDTGWRSIGQHEINLLQYDNLPPGKYSLQVRAKNNGGVWSRVRSSGIITIHPPFYSTLWFYFLVAIILFGAGYLFFKIIFITRHRRVLETEVASRTRQLLVSDIELRRLNDNLEEAIAERTRELENANKSLKEDLDIRKKMQAAIIELGQKYESIFKTAADPMLLVDAGSGVILDSNMAASKFYGYTREDFLQISFSRLFDEPDYGMETLTRQTYHLPYCLHRLQDGSTKPVELTANYFRQGEVLIGVVNLRDISRFIDSETRLQEYSKALEDLNSSKDKFFSIIAHDLKSPFHGLMGISEMLVAEFANFDKETLKNLIGRIHGLSKRLFLLVENLLNWSKLQTGRFEFSQEVVQPYLLVGEILEILKENYVSKEITIVNNISPEHLIYANPQMTNQIFQNLISNAIKFSFAGKSVIIHSRKLNDQFVEFLVADQGIGLSDADISKLFRLDIHYSTKGTQNEEGSGLGLLICKEMIEKHGGTISLTSIPGKGTNFTFTLPVYLQVIEQAS